MFTNRTARHIREEQARGRIGDLGDVDETARALIWMDERYLSEPLGRTPQTDPQVVVDVLCRIWIPTLYGRVESCVALPGWGRFGGGAGGRRFKSGRPDVRP